jgi:hypothetical protein
MLGILGILCIKIRPFNSEQEENSALTPNTFLPKHFSTYNRVCHGDNLKAEKNSFLSTSPRFPKEHFFLEVSNLRCSILLVREKHVVEDEYGT